MFFFSLGWEKSVSQPETIDLRFSPCGRFLHGAQNLPMKGWTHVTFPVYSSSLLLLGDSEDICNKSLLGSNENALELHSSVESKNRRIGLAPGELLVVTNDAGQPTLYSLQEEHHRGDVSLIRLSQSGALETQSIAQVPARESLKTGGVKIILGESSSDGTKLVFNSQSRSWHSPNAGSLSHMDSSKRFPTIYLREREDHGPWKPLTAESGSGMLVGIKRPLLLDDAEVQEEAQRRRLV